MLRGSPKGKHTGVSHVGFDNDSTSILIFSEVIGTMTCSHQNIWSNEPTSAHSPVVVIGLVLISDQELDDG